MKLRLSFASLLIAVITFFFSCEKEKSFEGGGIPPTGNDTGSIGGTAIFTLDGGTGDCTGAVLGGTYTAGTALTASNTVTLQVNVDNIGTYSVSSSSGNGISFNGTGSFTFTGPQTITLTGTGTPAAAGTFNFSFGSIGCSFSVTVVGSSGGDAVFSLGGSPASCTGFSVAGAYITGITLTASNTISVDVNVTTIGSYSITTNPLNGISFATSGNFTTTGNQPVTLTGSGVPAAEGTLVYSVSSGTNTCSFSLTTLPGGPAAVGTLDCTNAVPAGVYTQGAVLDAGNTISIPVNVTTAGTYSITTSAVNGITFSGSGTLTAGAQAIVLTGTGTPVNAGATSFPINLGTSSCSFSIDVLTGTSATDFLKCDIDGVATTFNTNLIGTVPVNTGFSIDGFQTSASPSPALSLSLNNLTGTVTTGTYNLLTLTNPSTIFCFPVYDDGSVTWTQSINNQPGTFTVLVATKTTNRITGTFSGTLYENDGAGPTAKTFTNGQFSVPY